ncbi:hypothetical protein [Leuconostoc lactis]|uniref:hypothetical protein n=1 Tax=Leuconostoc lactis TaxID=1246 RepID=UPI0024AE52A6|nr:hypothetical protein [Leuconostoc lactis]
MPITIMTQDTKLILFFIWVVIAMMISTGGLILIMRWYHREVDRVKKQQKASQNIEMPTTKQK